MAYGATKITTIRVDRDLHDVKSRVSDVHRHYVSRYSGNHYWKNSALAPDSDSIPSETKTHFYLKQADDRGTLEEIQEFTDPLVFTSNSKKTKIRCWDVGKIRSLSQDSPVSQSSDEYEVWVQHSSTKVASIISDVEDIEDAEEPMA